MPPSPARWPAGETAPRFHATSRPPYVEAVATARALAFARLAEAPVHVVHLSSAAALDEVRRAKAAGVRVTAETCPHYLVLTEERYDGARPGPVRVLRHLAAAAVRGGPRCALGRPRRRLAGPRRHRPRRRTAWASRRPRPARGVPFDRISNGAPGIETLLTLLYSEGVATGRITHGAPGRPARDDAGAALRAGLEGRDRGRPRRGPRRLRPGRRAARSARPTSTTRATTRRTRASRSRAPSAMCSSAAAPSSATAPSSASAASAGSSSAARSPAERPVGL